MKKLFTIKTNIEMSVEADEGFTNLAKKGCELLLEAYGVELDLDSIAKENQEDIKVMAE